MPGVTGRMRRSGALPLLSAVAVVALAGCSAGKGGGNSSGGEGGGAPEPAAAAATVAITPATGAANVSVANPVSVTAANGLLESVVVTNSAGHQVRGAVSPDKTKWTSAEPLGYNKAYSVSAVAVNTEGKKTTAASRFTTVKPGNLTLPYLKWANGSTYGVGQPVVVHFDEPIKDKATAERSLVVTTNPPITGRWHWFGDQDVHWRPQTAAGHYWPAHTKVSVSAKVYGVHFGGGLYGQEDRSASFTIGDSLVAVANDASLQMKVYANGKMVRQIPFSAGRGGTTTGMHGETIDFWTRSGPHVVLDKSPLVRMWAGSYGIPKDSPWYYDEKIKYAVRISGAGEYVHWADWNIPKHGVSNDSHGCLNVDPDDAVWFYNNFGPGDVVDVLNTPRRLDPQDGLGDWTLSWSQWVAGSALG